MQKILPAVQQAIEHKYQVELELPISNINRVVGTIVGSEVSKRTVRKDCQKIRLLFDLQAQQDKVSVRLFQKECLCI